MIAIKLDAKTSTPASRTWSKHGTNISLILPSVTASSTRILIRSTTQTRNGQDLFRIFRLNHYHHLSWFVWPDRFHYSTTAKGDQHTQGNGCKCVAACSAYHEEFYCIGWFILSIAFPVAWYFESNWLQIFPTTRAWGYAIPAVGHDCAPHHLCYRYVSHIARRGLPTCKRIEVCVAE